MHLKTHSSKCFICRQSLPDERGYSFGSERFCQQCAEPYLKSIATEKMGEYFLTRLPEPILQPGSGVVRYVPDLLQPTSDAIMPDFWALDSRDPDLVMGGFAPDRSSPDDSRVGEVLQLDSDAKTLFPFRTTFTRCGNPLVRSLPLSQFSDQVKGDGPNVHLLDMSGYAWTHTHKDARSYAIANVARELGVRHLALWTAGNAALGLAMAVNLQNAFLDESERIQVHALVYRGTSPQIINTLTAYGAIVTEIAQFLPVRRDEVFAIVNDSYRKRTGTDQSIDKATYWDVTDGLDGVGVLMYRLLFAQVVRAVKPQIVIAPCGTGSLFVGAYLGMLDVVRGDSPSCTLIGALPKGVHALRSIQKGRIYVDFVGPDADTSDWPVAPKTAVSHTALGPCIRHLLGGADWQNNWLMNDSARVAFVEIDKEEQISAGAALAPMRHGEVPPVAFEPSGLLQFAAIAPALDRAGLGTDPSILVVNTGCGIMAEREHAFLTSLRRIA